MSERSNWSNSSEPILGPDSVTAKERPERATLLQRMLLAATIAMPVAGVARAIDVGVERDAEMRDRIRAIDAATSPDVHYFLGLREHREWSSIADIAWGDIRGGIQSQQETEQYAAFVDRLSDPRGFERFELTTLARDVHAGKDDDLTVRMRRLRVRLVPPDVRVDQVIRATVEGDVERDIVTDEVYGEGRGNTVEEAKTNAFFNLIERINASHRAVFAQVGNNQPSPRYFGAGPYPYSSDIGRRSFGVGTSAGPTTSYSTEFFGEESRISFAEYDAVSYAEHPRMEVRQVRGGVGEAFHAYLSVELTDDSGGRFMRRRSY